MRASIKIERNESTTKRFRITNILQMYAMVRKSQTKYLKSQIY